MLEFKVYSKGLKQDFVSKTEDGYNLYDLFFNEDVPYLSSSFEGDNLYFVAIEKKMVVGLICLSFEDHGWFGYPECKWSMMNIGVDKKYRNKGIAKILIENMFRFSDENNITGISQSSYSEDGIKYIEPIFKKVSSIYPNVIFIDDKKLF